MSESLDNHLVHGRRQRPDGPSPIDVISVQSQLVYGHAQQCRRPADARTGRARRRNPDRAAEQCAVLRHYAGPRAARRLFADLLLGTHERGLPQRAKMLVSGYFGSTANGAAFADWLDNIRRPPTAALLPGPGDR